MGASIRCACGAIEGRVEEPRVATRARCYCKDCQAFARFLGEPRYVLDDRGGTDIIATVPGHVQFTRGVDQLQCMSLKPRGLLRWYCRACRTPIGNTPRAAINTQSATGPVTSARLRLLFSLLKIMRNVLGARVSGAWRSNPFFRQGTAQPMATPVGPETR